VLLIVIAIAVRDEPIGTVPNERVVVEMPTTAGLDPLPDSATVCGLPVVLSEIETEALKFPPEIGEKVTLIVQAAPAAIVVQLFVCENWLAFVPVRDTEDTVTVPGLALVRVMVCGALLVPTACAPKPRAEGRSVTAVSSAAQMPRP
jgi:hypothetical protein